MMTVWVTWRTVEDEYKADADSGQLAREQDS